MVWLVDIDVLPYLMSSFPQVSFYIEPTLDLPSNLCQDVTISQGKISYCDWCGQRLVSLDYIDISLTFSQVSTLNLLVSCSRTA